MDALREDVGQGGVDGALALDAVQTFESGRDDLDGEMALAARIVAGMAAVQRAVVAHNEMGRSERLGETSGDFGGHGTGASVGHCAYIWEFIWKGSCLASDAKRTTRFHGRIGGQRKDCAHPGCEGPGEFRVPPRDGRRADFNGPGEWRWMCLDHVRAFNGSYNYFNGMSPEEIEAAQTPYGGWERQTRAFAAAGADLPPRWSDFVDPLDAIGARFGANPELKPRIDGRELSTADRKLLKVLGLDVNADRRALRKRYLDLVRRYHPDRNGGDRSHEKALQAVIDAYTALKSRPAFA
jgi:DnaJ-like protein